MLKNLTSLQKLVRGLKIVFISTFLLVFLTIPQKSYTRDQISQGRIYPSQRPSLRSGGSSSRPAYQKPWQKSQQRHPAPVQPQLSRSPAPVQPRPSREPARVQSSPSIKPTLVQPESKRREVRAKKLEEARAASSRRDIPEPIDSPSQEVTASSQRMALNGIVANSQNHIQLPRFPSESNSNVGNSFYLPHPVTFKSFQERFPEIKNPSREKVLEFAKQQAALSVQKVLKMQRGDREIEAMIPLSPIISVREAEGMPGPEAMSLFSRANNMQIENLLGVTKSGRKYYFAFEYPSKEVVSSAKPVERLLPSTLGAITPAAAITRIGDLARRAEPPWARKDYWDSRTGWKNYTWHPDKDFQGLLPTYGGYRLEKIGRSYVDNKNFIWQEFKMIPKLGKLPTEIRLLRYKAN